MISFSSLDEIRENLMSFQDKYTQNIYLTNVLPDVNKTNPKLIDEIKTYNTINNIEIKVDLEDQDDYDFITKTDSECKTDKISLDHKCFPIFDKIFYKYFIKSKYFLTPGNAYKRC